MAETVTGFHHVTELAAHYRFPDGDGSEQTIGIVTTGGHYERSLTEAYFVQIGVEHPLVEVVGLAEGSADSGPVYSVAMAVEIVGALVPRARLVVYTGTDSPDGLVETLVAAVSDGPSVVLVNFGIPESGDSAIRARADEALRNAALRGVTVVCAGGDGPHDHMTFPQSSPWVLTVGGTAFDPDADPPRDIVWLSPERREVGSFGGQSGLYAVPHWQAGLSLTPVGGDARPLSGRGVPDVAAFAEPSLVLNIDGQDVAFGGTEASAGLWAGLVARLSQAVGGLRLGLLAPLLYAERPGLTAVTEGDNGVYVATPGWNGCTGLGVPDGELLRERLREFRQLPLPVPGLDTGAPRTNVRSGYSPDDAAGGRDALGFGTDVEVLANLVAADDVRPPLSIGLFGEWGSGKSFFMRMLEERVEQLAADTRAARAAEPPRPSDYCGEVVQIRFNAWNYVEGNVWAGLVTRVWDALHEHYATHQAHARYQQLLAELSGKEAEVARLREEVSTRERELDRVRAQLRAPDAVSDDPKVAAAAERLARTIGDEAAAQPIEALHDRYGELRSAAGGVKRGWQTLASPGARRVRVLASVVGLAVLVLGAAVFIGAAHGLGRAAVVVVTALSAYVVPALAAATVAARAMRHVLEQPAVKAREEELANRRGRLEAAEADLARVSETARAATAHGGLYALTQERQASADYRQHLGILGLVQRDMERLSERLVPPAGAPPPTDDDPERIVLYIDDLDRCEPRLVTQVLQAIHLLLAYPLFVVVVGVDVRWLTQALESEYRQLLGSGSADGANRALATPQDYLEKIFQIPVWLPSMDATAFGQLVSGLTEDAPAAQAVGASPVLGRGPIAGPAVNGEAARPQAAQAGTSAPARPAAAPAVPTPESLSASVLSVTQAERDFAAELAPLIPTPRIAKRLINVYRLVRAQEGGETPETFRELLVLLAIVSGFPREAPTLLHQVERQAGTWSTLVSSLTPGPGAASAHRWTVLAERLAAVPAPDSDIERYRRWVPLVSRYSFLPRPAASGSTRGA